MRKVLFIVLLLFISFLTSIPSLNKANATINPIQVGPVVALPMDTVIADIYSTSLISNNVVRMIDSTAFHNDATNCATGSLSTYVVGVHGGAQLFTNSQCWKITDLSNNSTHANSFGNYLTLSSWVRIDSIPISGLSCIISKPSEYAMCLDNAGKLEILLGGTTQYTGTTPLSTNIFYNLATTWNSTHIQLYINGRNDTNPTPFSSSITENSNPLFVGAGTCCSIVSPWSGIIDTVYLFKRPLSPTEIVSLASQSINARPIDSYTPDTQVGGGGTSSGYYRNNPELIFAQASTTNNADINGTTYIPGAISIHQVVNVSITGVIGSTNCSNSGLFINLCGYIRYQWDFFHNGIFQEGMGVAINVDNNGGANCIGLNICNLNLRFYKIVGNTFTDLFVNPIFSINNNTSTKPVRYWWIGIDFWIFQDNKNIGIRVTNFDSKAAQAWSYLCAGPDGCFSQYVERVVKLVDTSQNVHTIDWFDPYVQQNIEAFAHSGVTTGPLVAIVDHQAGFMIDGLCTTIVNLGLSITNFLAGTNLRIQNCGSLLGSAGGIGPPTLPGNGNGQNCGLFQPVCDIVGGISNSLISGMSNIMQPILNAIEGLASSIAASLIFGLGGAWQVFVGGIDQAIFVITGQQNVFTNFVNQTLGPLISNITTVLGNFSVDFTATVSTVSTLLGFFSSSTPNGVNILSIINKFLSNIIGTGTGSLSPFVTAIWGVIGFFAASFGIGNGASGTQFNVGGTTFDWGPGALFVKSFIPLFLVLGFVWLFQRFMSDPMHESQQMFWFVYVFAGVLIAMLGWFFEVTFKIAGFIRDLIPIF